MIGAIALTVKSAVLRVDVLHASSDALVVGHVEGDGFEYSICIGTLQVGHGFHCRRQLP